MTVHVVLPLDVLGTKFTAKKKKIKLRGYHLEGPARVIPNQHPANLIAHIRWLHEIKMKSYREIHEAFPEIKGLKQVAAILTYKHRHRIDAAPCIEYMDRLKT